MQSVLPAHIDKRVTIEMASTFGWERYAGRDGLLIGINTFGASAPGDLLAEHFGFIADQIQKRIIEKYSN